MSVLTDDTVITDQDGRESVICSRSDGFGLDMLRQHGKVHAMILSREENPVVSARARKLKIEVYQGVQDKAQAIQQLIKERNLDQAEVIYIGNDIMIGGASICRLCLPSGFPSAGNTAS